VYSSRPAALPLRTKLHIKPTTINRAAKDVYDNPKITTRIAELQAQHSLDHNITVKSLILELEDARKVAKDNDHPTAMVGATMGKAKLLGLDKPSSDDEEKGKPLSITFNVSEAKNTIKVTKGE